MENEVNRRGFLSVLGGLGLGAVVGATVMNTGGANAVDPCEPTPTTPVPTTTTPTTTTPTTTTPPPSGIVLPYTSDSFYKSTVHGAPIEAARTAAFVTFMNTFADQKAWKHPRLSGVGSNKWGTPYALGNGSHPRWVLTGNMNSKCNILKTQGFHAPAEYGAVLTGTSDSPFCVVDVQNGYTVFGTNAKLVRVPTGTEPGVISVGTAGITYHSSNGLDYRNPRSNDTRNFTSRGRISDSMVIRADLVREALATGGDLGHTLHLFIAESKSSDGFCHPMTGAEGSKNGFGAEGERIAIRPNVDVNSKVAHPVGKVIARTLQNYGCYIGDNSGSDSRLKAEQDNTISKPWAGLNMNLDVLKGLTWEDWFVLPKGWQ